MIRITGGEFRGHTLQTPRSEKTRPTQAKLRQALFNSLQTHIFDAKVLDLFAGSGALGFEALSRGAAFAVFVEQAMDVVKIIERNAKFLGVEDRVLILHQKVETAWEKLISSGPFDIVLADPPYAAYADEIKSKFLESPPWEQILAPSSRLCLEWGLERGKKTALAERSGLLIKVREKTYGDSVLTTYERLEGESHEHHE